jgi:hypothetical protein
MRNRDDKKPPKVAAEHHDGNTIYNKIMGAFKTAIGGSGVAVALAGVLNVLAAIFSAHPFGNFQTHHLELVCVIGAIVGGILGWIYSSHNS